MAVVADGTRSRQQAFGGRGTLQLTADCVVLRTPDIDVLLIWREEEVRWDADAQAIIVVQDDGPPLVLTNGATIAVGGGAPRDDANWIKMPSGCPGVPLVVHNVELALTP